MSRPHIKRNTVLLHMYYYANQKCILWGTTGWTGARVSGPLPPGGDGLHGRHPPGAIRRRCALRLAGRAGQDVRAARGAHRGRGPLRRRVLRHRGGGGGDDGPAAAPPRAGGRQVRGGRQGPLRPPIRCAAGKGAAPQAPWDFLDLSHFFEAMNCVFNRSAVQSTVIPSSVGNPGVWPIAALTPSVGGGVHCDGRWRLGPEGSHWLLDRCSSDPGTGRQPRKGIC